MRRNTKHNFIKNVIRKGELWLLFLLIVILCAGCAQQSQEQDVVITEQTTALASSTAYKILNGNEPDFREEEKTTEAFEAYSSFDSLGRCGVAYANICREIMPTEERGEIGMIKPSGWHTIKYDCVDGKYLYNRCHLIGYQLAGENANERNLITGTRYMNVEGMLPFENQVADYVQKTGNHVLYRVTPVFQGNNLVADGVEMEAFSVEDNGEGVKFHVFVYNIQPGVEIDYVTGDSWLAGEQKVEELQENDADVESEHAQQQSSDSDKQDSDTAQQATYILNTNTHKFHYPTCSSVDDMKEKNKKEFHGSRDEAIAQGYVPCKRCNP